MGLKLYILSDGPPSISVMQTLAALEIPCELVKVNFGAGEHMTEQYAKMNPQKEIPVLDDNGFFLSESTAIMQYLCDKYKPGTDLYPQDPKARAIVNQRLCYNLSFYYVNILTYAVMPIYFDYQRTPQDLRKVHMALDVFDTLLSQLGTSHVAADHLTIADFAFLNATMTLEVIDFDFSKYTKVQKWYDGIKKNHPKLWKITEAAMKEMRDYVTNPPDWSHLEHPLHPVRKIKQ